MAGSHYPIILACDADSFFVQVETLRNPALQGKALAIQQHQDIIAANHAAKQAGVKKHMAPNEARAVLAEVGGEVVHVFCEEGLRVSYRPYRETSAALMRLLKRFPAAAVVERASIDEAYIQMHGPGGAALPVGSSLDQLLSHGEQLANQIRAAVKSELGITISVGVSCNKLLAKLACRMAKPDGVRSIAPGSPAMRDMLANTSIDKLPGMGGRAAMLLASQGVHDCGALSALLVRNPAALTQLGLNPKKATLLENYCKGQDETPVTDKGPPHSFQVQMTLTPVPIPAPNLLAGKESVTQLPHNKDGMNTDGSAGAPSSMLQPLPVQGPDTRPRMSRLLHHMCRDLVSRVVLDRHQEGRWPRRLVVQLFCQLPSHKGPAGSGNTSHSTTRSTAFPTAALLDNPSLGSRQMLGSSTIGNQASAQPPTATHISAGFSIPPLSNQPETASVLQPPKQLIVNGLEEASDSRAPAAGSSSALVVSERTFDSGEGHAQGLHRGDGASNVLSAVHQTVEALVVAMLQKQPLDWVVTQVALSATNMVPYESASAPTIAKFITRTNPASASTYAVGQQRDNIPEHRSAPITGHEHGVQARTYDHGLTSSSLSGHKRDAAEDAQKNNLQQAFKRSAREVDTSPRATTSNSRLEVCGRTRDSTPACSTHSQLEPVILTQVFAQIAGSIAQHDTVVLADLQRKLTALQAKSKLKHHL